MFASTVSACTKEGPQGVQGEQGPAGPQGPQGPEGHKGDSGIANVYSSGWIDVKLIHFEEDPISPWRGSILDDKITNELILNSSGHMYVNLGDTSFPYIHPLPYTFGVDFIRGNFVPGQFRLEANFDASTYYEPYHQRQYKYVFIPHGVNKNNDVNLWKLF